EERAIILDERIKQTIPQIEDLGLSAKVDEALALFMHVERMKGDLNALKERIDAVNPLFKNENRLGVCDVCGALLVPNDASKRLDAHNEGKQHQGYLRIQRALEEFKKEGGAGREELRGARSRERHSSTSRRYGRAGSRDRSHSREPHNRRDKRRYDDRGPGYSHRDSSRRRRRDDRRY
ncbi:splicing factor, partial [Coemansia erecta]